MIETSHAANKPEKILMIINQRTFYCLIFGLSIGLIICAALQVANGFVIVVFTGLTAGIPAWISSFLYQGEFPGDRVERVQLKIAKVLKIFREAFTGWDIAGHWSIQPDHDPMSVYNAGGDEFIGFEVHESISQQELVTLCARLHRKLPSGCSVTYIRLAQEFVTEFLQKYRPALLEKRVMGVEYFVILKLPYLKAGREKRIQLLEDVPSTFYRIGRQELRHLTERIVDPYKRNDKGETPFFEASMVTDGRYAFPYPDECYAAISMSKLATYVDDRFVNVFKPAFGMRSIVSTTVTRQAGFKDSIANGYAAMREKGLIGLGGVTEAKKRSRMKAEEDEAAGDYIPLEIYCQALIYGRPGEVNDCIRKIKESSDIPDEVRPTMSPELGSIKGALSAVSPGSLMPLPTRSLKVRSLKEAGFYLPLFAPPTNMSVEYPFVLRTIHNTPAFINHAGLSESPLTLFVGKSGSGKSSLMTLMIRAHWLLGELHGRPVAIVVGDVGSSMTFMIDNALADLSFNMERVNGSDFPPLPIHPLHAFLEKDDSGVINNASRLLAREMLAFFLQASTRDAGVTTVIDKALAAMIESETVFRLSTFLGYMKRAAAQLIEEAPAGKDVLAKEWFDRSLRLGLFAKGGSYGAIFDPDEVQRHDMKGVVNFYYNMDEEIFQIPDLAGAYIGLCWSVARSIGQRFKSNNEEARDTLLLMDEFDKKSEFLGGLTLKDMKDQSRKYGIIPGLGIQSFDYLTMPDAKGSGRSKNTIYEGVGNTFFYGVGQEDVYPKISAIFEEVYIPGTEPRGKLKEMLDIARSIAQAKEDADKAKTRKLKAGQERKERVYSVGFFDSSRKVQHLYVDVERDFLWMFTTHPGGRAIRNAVRREVEQNLIKASLLLARHGPWPIPSETPSPKEIKEIMERISYAKED